MAIRILWRGFTRLAEFLELRTTASEMAVIAEARLFDPGWYLERNPQVVRRGLDPLAHYLAHGAVQGRNPHPLFDDEWYLAQNPDVALAEVNPLLHYITQGASEGRDPHPLFDSDWYLAKNPDVALAEVNPLAHYIRQGAFEGRDPHPLFDSDWYLAQNSDAAAKGVNPLIHYIATGASEGRDPHPLFDSDWYLAENPDVARQGINPLAHYIQDGSSEGRHPHPLFDNDWYLSQNPALAQMGIDPLAHYVAHGATAGCEPNRFFRTPFYVALNPDAGKPDTTPLTHYLAGNNRLQDRREAAFTGAAACFESLAAVEPELLRSVAPQGIQNLTYVTGQSRGRVAAAWRKLFDSLLQTYDRMIFIPSLGLSTTDVVGLNILAAAQQRHGLSSTLLVINEEPDLSGQCAIPPGSHVRVVSELHPRLSAVDRADIIAHLIYHLQPKAVLNVADPSLWQAIEEHGPALSRVASLHGWLTPRTRAPDGRFSGLTDRYFRSCFPYMTRLYSDTAYLRDLLVREYGVPVGLKERLAIIYCPARPDRARFTSRPDKTSGSRVFWAIGEPDENFASLVMQVAGRCPDVTFELHSAREDLRIAAAGVSAPNVLQQTAHPSFAVEGASYTAFFCTSIGDGLPATMIDMAALGVPVVASEVSGISELVDAETGWPVGNDRQGDGYVAALYQIERKPEEAARRVANMLARIGSRHSWDRFVNDLSQAPCFLD
jgi:hypothetical protein